VLKIGGCFISILYCNSIAMLNNDLQEEYLFKVDLEKIRLESCLKLLLQLKSSRLLGESIPLFRKKPLYWLPKLNSFRPRSTWPRRFFFAKLQQELHRIIITLPSLYTNSGKSQRSERCFHPIMAVPFWIWWNYHRGFICWSEPQVKLRNWKPSFGSKTPKRMLGQGQS